MRTNSKSVFLATLMIFSTLTALAIPPTVEASEVVITEAIQIDDGGSASDRMAAVGADSEGNVHVVWSRSKMHLYYSMYSAKGDVLIKATQITNAGVHTIEHPDMVIDDEDRVHITWADKRNPWKIMYTVLRPYNTAMDGEASDDITLSAIDDFEVSSREGNRDWPAIDIDSKGNIHIVWQDEYDELNIYFEQPQIYYAMLQPDYEAKTALKLFSETLLTPIIGHKGHPDVAVDANDNVQIVWDDTRGGKVELVFVIDGSGSMGTEWGDMCTVVYGGNFASGGYFQGLKPMLEAANMTVFETLYVLYDGYSYPSEITNNPECSQRNNIGQPWRNGWLDVGDDSGGIRQLPATVFNGASYSGTSGEDWGPGTNWACLSWRDANGNMHMWADPPTANDHQWNPNATKIVIPISDEGPKDGSPEQQSDDLQSIIEAHDSCVEAGIVPAGLYGQSWGGANPVASHMEDLVQCPNGVVSTQPRNCPGSTVSNTHAGGQAWEFPSGGNNQMQSLVEAMVYISTNNSREIYTTILDPYGKMDNDPTWLPGQSGHETIGGMYGEDTGWGDEGHLVVVNDTRVSINDAYSFHPSIGIDGQSNTHIAWMDARDYSFAEVSDYEIYYTKLRMQGSGDWDGAEEGLSTYAIKRIDDTPISTVECPNPEVSSLPVINSQCDVTNPSSMYPSLLTDYRNNVHISWIDFANSTSNEEIRYVRLNQTDLTGPGWDFETGTGALDRWEHVAVTNWTSNKLSAYQASKPMIGQPPAMANDLGSGAHIAWADNKKCSDEPNNNRYTICYSHVLTGQVDIDYLVEFDYRHTVEPGEETVYNLTVMNTTPGPRELVADSYSFDYSMSATILDLESNQRVPVSTQNWTATLHYATNKSKIQPTDLIFLNGSESMQFYLKVKAPSIYQAGDFDVDCEVIVTAVAESDPAIRSDKPTITTMDVVHGIDLETSHRLQDVEQGKPATFSITITNTGNVVDSFSFYLGAQPSSQVSGEFTDWQLPFGWTADSFPTQVVLNPDQKITKNLQLNIPSTEDPGTFVIYLEGLSDGEPIRIIEKGTYDVLELWVNVSIKTTDNVVFFARDPVEQIHQGDCHDYEVEVTKRDESGDLVFSMPGAPPAPPEGVDLGEWRQNNWTAELLFGNNDYPPLNDPNDVNSGRKWPADTPITVTVRVCAPITAPAGLGPAVTVKAHLKGYPKVSDSEIFSTKIIHEYRLDASTPNTQMTVNPGEEWLIPVTVENTGNGPDRYDLRMASVTDASGVEVQWDITVPRDKLFELSYDNLTTPKSQTVDVIMKVPKQVQAGQYTLKLNAFSEELYEGTRLRDTVTVVVIVNEFYDMQISIDETQDNPLKITAPGRIVKYIVNVTNAGNVPDTPRLHNHTQIKDPTSGEPTWVTTPGMGSLSDWVVSWSLVEFIGSDLTRETPCETSVSSANAFPEDTCVYLNDINEWRLPEMAPYSTNLLYATVQVSPSAVLDTREIGLKVTSVSGNMEDGGDYDDSLSWAGTDLDSNELVITLRLRAPDLVISKVSVENKDADVGETIPVQIILKNTGNVQANDVEIVLCEYDEIDDDVIKDLQKDGCPDENIVMRQSIGAIQPPDATGEANEIEVYMLYPVTAGSYEVVVLVDPQNSIVEVSEKNNVMVITSELSSSSPIWDVTKSIVGTYSLPTGIILLTFSLFSVLYLVGRGRRADVKDRLAEQSSLVSVLNDD